jgi:hypothetical protein
MGKRFPVSFAFDLITAFPNMRSGVGEIMAETRCANDYS